MPKRQRFCIFSFKRDKTNQKKPDKYEKVTANKLTYYVTAYTNVH